ncbi:hypothetical protein P691DRAFT_688882 [Macrolepiota fuliginosa MF-IS2]|uniref:Uncharacterized protein n=1 Tax=Macrolepiota fuliginosa MF-IS2 TaxID=1400762 RepID=A0A9P5WZ93_9AGAR|nr:hypothetical protein P691DRAFT_688882 [Macrolepiota fuliginosa MF-IS2]
MAIDLDLKKKKTNTLKKYNTAANAMIPRGHTLSWNEVIKYVFLSNFDLLRDCQQDLNVDTYIPYLVYIPIGMNYKKELSSCLRCWVYVPIVVTHLHAKETFLLAKESEVAKTDPDLACQIKQYQSVHTQFNNVHMQCFKKLATLPRFSGSILPGVSHDKSLHTFFIGPPTQVAEGEGQANDGSDKEEEFDHDSLHEDLDALIAVSY